MQLAYEDLNRREYELTKHASLRQVSPRALLELRTTGQCTVDLPEELFDFDGPGHYFRRLKAVAVSIPCVAGPYGSVSCTLTLLNSSIRTSPALGDGYARQGEDTARFSDHFGGVEAIVTSNGSQDTGLFETSLYDERLLLFEGSGAISRWRLELPADIPQFDHGTISDVVLHLRYQAREGGWRCVRRPPPRYRRRSRPRRRWAPSGCCLCGTSFPPNGRGSQRPQWTTSIRWPRSPSTCAWLALVWGAPD